MRRILPSLFVAFLLAFASSRPGEIAFEKHTIDLGASETAAFADINNNGKLDIVSAESGYEVLYVNHDGRS
jgi:hypothetical protein